MNDLLLYLLKSSVCLALFYTIYWAFLKKETYFVMNRFYLLGSIAASFILPLIKFPSPFLVRDVVSIPETMMPEAIYTPSPAPTITDILLIVYLIGMGFYFIRFIIQLLKFIHLSKYFIIFKSPKYQIVNVDMDIPPFSFLGTIFIHRPHFSDDELDRIIAHEKVHIKQKHSIDLILMDLLTIVQWYNPFVWPYKRSIKETHEYLADAGVIAQGFCKANYQMLILEQFVGGKLFAFANNFNQSQLKRRITMMTKHKSKNLAKSKVLIVAPLICLLILAFARPRLITHSDSGNQPVLNAALLSQAAPQDKVVKTNPEKDVDEETVKKYEAMKIKYEENRIKEKEIALKFDVKKLDLKEQWNKAETEEDKHKIEDEIKKLSLKRDQFKKEASSKKKEEEHALQELATKIKGKEYAAHTSNTEKHEKLIEKISYEIKMIEEKINKAETKEEKKELTLKQKELMAKRTELKKELAAQYENENQKKKKTKTKTKEASI
jgi:hypothetical protein